MTTHQLDVVTADCQDARQQADTARDLASRLRTERAGLETRHALRRWDIGDRTPETLRVLDEAIVFLSALGGQP
jgi:hypothetical protein